VAKVFFTSKISGTFYKLFPLATSYKIHQGPMLWYDENFGSCYTKYR
jgi:hypothetical protein